MTLETGWGASTRKTGRPFDIVYEIDGKTRLYTSATDFENVGQRAMLGFDLRGN